LFNYHGGFDFAKAPFTPGVIESLIQAIVKHYKLKRKDPDDISANAIITAKAGFPHRG
jgi:hypothetical protein